MGDSFSAEAKVRIGGTLSVSVALPWLRKRPTVDEARLVLVVGRGQLAATSDALPKRIQQACLRRTSAGLRHIACVGWQPARRVAIALHWAVNLVDLPMAPW